MKGSEALLRAIAAEGGTIAAVRLNEWMKMLQGSGLVKASMNQDDNLFYWELTDKAKAFLKKKGALK
ncbi:hypothetical protein QRX25_10550 [Bacillus sp. L381]|uniref:hypothetical protein n=1 Tax=Bacillus TaxID=1386 RepID=UPI001BADAF4A|nr:MULTISPECIES: hypothetical protein [Bacillus]MCR9040923.1 hypothetical protein [Bacillus velezensis]QUN07992.1 hypothetical protein KEF49_10400 [Bacillus amyloliquefaciens]QYM81058.1 hypothetical protein KTJ85_10250 [Bacillus sp. 7D3]QZY10206.1 hypothetical protein K7B13_10480 [Bacillus amyloliquefaciens]QZY11116.1 hypothetical protein K7B13_15480 [Bacillus amyloliquefaciens]